MNRHQWGSILSFKSRYHKCSKCGRQWIMFNYKDELIIPPDDECFCNKGFKPGDEIIGITYLSHNKPIRCRVLNLRENYISVQPLQGNPHPSEMKYEDVTWPPPPPEKFEDQEN